MNLQVGARPRLLSTPRERKATIREPVRGRCGTCFGTRREWLFVRSKKATWVVEDPAEVADPAAGQ